MIPAYRPGADYLRSALESVLQQDPGSGQMQIEVVDDSSPDVDVAALVRTVAGGRVAFSSTSKNLGLAGCWNACIERARGEWVHILHQDDLVRPGFYDGLRRLIGAHPAAGAAFSRYAYINAHGDLLAEAEALQTAAGPIHGAVEVLAVKNQVQCPAIVVRRAAYKTVGGFDGRYVFGLDWEMWLRLAARFPVLYHPESLAAFRVNIASETSRLARSGETVHDAMRLIATFPNYLAADRAAAIQTRARHWACDVSLQKAGKYLQDRQPQYAMAQLHAVLRYDRRWSSWNTAFGIWARFIKRNQQWPLPPLPFLPESWFRDKL